VAEFDVIVIGAGAAGVCATHVLHALGLKVALVASRDELAPCFKAEKLEPDQIARLREMDLMRLLEDVISPLREVVIYRRRSIIERQHIDQFGMHYHSFVNALRHGVPSEVVQFSDTATSLQLSDDRQVVQLAKSGTIGARLVVLAAGVNSRLRHLLRASRREIAAHHTVAFGFDLSLAAGRLPHDGVNFLPDNVSSRVGFLTLFPTPTGARANLFVYQDAHSDWCRKMRTSTAAMLNSTFSNLHNVVGPHEVVGRVEAAVIDLWTTDSWPDDGAVLIGDSFQSVCPATGTGLSKVLSDVHNLGQHASRWFQEPGMSAAKISSYYESSEKQRIDRHSLDSAFYSKSLATDHSLRFQLTRLRRRSFGRWRSGASTMR
jgi:2-polyprenyl-6-methoxyphenol hydroxylase-like FAD-dependent oxidoreductase